MADLEDLFAALEDREKPRDEEIKQLQQEVLRLKEQHIDFQGHAEDLQYRSNRNNIGIRGASHRPENGDTESYMWALFSQVMDVQEPPPIRIDLVHRIGLSHAGPRSLPTY
ncbi:hypothetical protein NDU88_006656 [Pleurodeles waltl]|uniref:Uncharacterized protein n=1 Tax=Pleurodeles waltl TaxID=8319 RepID=A0AAV7WB80_PLEWA|nr:hypothetical protein NDU88_006656 [Pleurodeles waltl]